jgi:hypothetical protein
MKGLFRFLAWSACVSGLAGSAQAQFEHGTIVLVDISQTKAIVAADSRGSTPGELPDDHECKIVALGDKMLFAAAGVFRNPHYPSKAMNWSASSDAVEIYRNVRIAKSDDALAMVAAEWAKKMKAHYAFEEKHNLRNLLEATTTDALLGAVFVGLDNRGTIEARELSFTFDREKARKLGFSDLKSSNQPWLATPAMVLKALGHAEIANEFAYKTTPRAEVEDQRWRLEPPSHSEDPDALYLEHLVNLEISYATADAGVGGNVDVALLVANGTIRWPHLKKECAKLEPSQITAPGH